MKRIHSESAEDLCIVLLAAVLLLAVVCIVWAAVAIGIDFVKSIVEHGGFWEYMAYLFHNNLA